MTGGSEEREQHPLLRVFGNLIKHQEVTSASAVPPSLTGQRISDNEVIL